MMEEFVVEGIDFLVITFVVSDREHMGGMGFAIAGIHECSGREATFAQFGFLFFLAHGANIGFGRSETKKRVLRKPKSCAWIRGKGKFVVYFLFATGNTINLVRFLATYFVSVEAMC